MCLYGTINEVDPNIKKSEIQRSVGQILVFSELMVLTKHALSLNIFNEIVNIVVVGF